MPSLIRDRGTVLGKIYHKEMRCALYQDYGYDSIGTMISRLGNMLILAGAFFFSSFKGKANRKVLEPQTVLLIQMAKLGDMVCTTPMFRAVKIRYPNCKVVVAGLPFNQELLDKHPDVDEYIVWQENFMQMWRKIRRYRFDFACVATPSFIHLACLYLSGIPSIATPIVVNGFCPVETRLYRVLRKLVVAVPYRMGFYAPREYLRLLEPAGIFSEDTSKCLNFSKNDEKQAENFLRTSSTADRLYVAIAPGAGHKVKQWPAERFASLADYISANYQVRILLIGGPKDTAESREMLARMKYRHGVIDTVGQLSLGGLKALISKTHLLIGADTGPIYIAEAFGVPTIDIVGPMDEYEQPPRGPKHSVVVAERKAPAMHILNARQIDMKEARRQVEAITTEMVVAALDELWPKLRRH